MGRNRVESQLQLVRPSSDRGLQGKGDQVVTGGVASANSEPVNVPRDRLVHKLD